MWYLDIPLLPVRIFLTKIGHLQVLISPTNHIVWLSFDYYIASLRQTTDFAQGYIAERACQASRPTWGIASLRQTTDFTPGYIVERACRASRHSVKLRTLPQDASLRERVQQSSVLDLANMMTLPTQECRQWQCVIFRSEFGSRQCTHCPRQTIAVGLPLSIYNARVNNGPD
jgi:hypothetical protein